MKISPLTLLIGTLLLSGCVSIPQTIQGNKGQLVSATYPDISQNIARYKGQQVRVGGKVLNVVNSKQGTLFEMAVLPLDSGARPEPQAAFQGRVLVKSAKFIDPLTLKDRLVTVLGRVDGETLGKVGEADYAFLTLNLQGYQVWHIQDDIVPVNYPAYGAFGPSPYWSRGWGWGPVAPGIMPGWGPDWGPYPYQPVFKVEPELVP